MGKHNMRGPEGQQKENFFIVIGAIAVFAILIWITARSPYILHRFELPLLKTQSAVYSVVSSVYEKENELLGSFTKFLNEEYQRYGYRRINAGRARDYAHKYGRATILTTKIISVFVLVGAVFPFIRLSRAAKKKAYDRDQYITLPDAKGVEGFIAIIGKYLPADIKERLKAEPTSENISAAFTIAREKANIPNNLAGRLFPRWSKERIAIYEYGKGIVEYDLNKMMNPEENRDGKQQGK